MPARYEVWLTRDNGTRLRILDDNAGFYYIRNVNAPGAFRIFLPPTYETWLPDVDRRVEFWRAPQDGVLSLEFVGFVRRWHWTRDAAGAETLALLGPDLVELLDRRIVAFAAGESEASKNNNADSIMKEVVDENMVTNRAIPNLTVQIDKSHASILDKGFAWRNVLLVCQDLAEASFTQGIPLYFDIVPHGNSPNMQFQTFINQRGQDRTQSGSAAPTLFGLEFENLAEPLLEYDHSMEITYAYAGGQGEGTFREVQEVNDAARLNASLYNRREAFKDARNEPLAAAVYDAAQQLLAKGEPVARLEGKLSDTDATRYGRDWHFGDKVTVTYRNIQQDLIVKQVRIDVDGNKNETITARTEA